MCGTIFQLHQFITAIFPYLFDKLKMCPRPRPRPPRRRHRETLAVTIFIWNHQKCKWIQLHHTFAFELFYLSVWVCVRRVASSARSAIQLFRFIGGGGGVCVVVSSWPSATGWYVVVPSTFDSSVRTHPMARRCVADTPSPHAAVCIHLCSIILVVLITAMNYCHCVFILSANAPAMAHNAFCDNF